MGILRALALVALLSSCSAEYHFKRACKLEPMFCESEIEWQFDTTIIRDSLYFYNTYYTKSVDTIFIDSGGVQVRIIRNNNYITTEIKRPNDTIRVNTTRTIKAPTKWRIIDLNKWFLGVVVLALIALWVFSQKRK
jgi:hypothetical protein